MSNDTPRPNPDSRKTESAASKNAAQASEEDLWDLDDDDTKISAPPISPPSRSEGIPASRGTAESSIQSKKPTEPVQKPQVSAKKTASKPKAEKIQEPAMPQAKEEPAEDTSTSETPQWEAKDYETTSPQGPESLPIIGFLASLSKVEKIAISGLCAALLLLAILSLVHFYNRVPIRPLLAEDIDFPVAGKIVEITEASTYWRAPVTEGEKADVVRRGTKFIPVVQLNLSSKTGAIRVFFRNEDDIVVGDGISRTVQGEAELTIAATAGFADEGMHTAYRTGDNKPWVVQVFEGPDAAAPSEKFRKVLEMEISTMIR